MVTILFHKHHGLFMSRRLYHSYHGFICPLVLVDSSSTWFYKIKTGLQTSKPASEILFPKPKSACKKWRPIYSKIRGALLIKYSIVQRNARKKWEAILDKNIVVGSRFPMFRHGDSDDGSQLSECPGLFTCRNSVL